MIIQKIIGTIVLLIVTSSGFAANLSTQLVGEVNDSSVLPAIKVLKSATINDSVIILIDTDGGMVFSGFKLMEAMETSKASKVVVYIPKKAYSMGAHIASAADYIVISKYASIMVHTGSYQEPGGPVVVFDGTQKDRESRDWYNYTIAGIISEFGSILSGDELATIKHGESVYITGEELFKRDQLAKDNFRPVVILKESL